MTAKPRTVRPEAAGKVIRLADRPVIITGVSYGTFAPDAAGWQFPAADRLSKDFALMAACGINTVRTYTAPPPALLDEAARHGLYVMVGLAWPQHVAFLDDRSLCRKIRGDVASQVRALAAHPSVLLFAIGNEIPASIVRWHGRHRVERFVRDLHDTARAVSPESLFTYVNYPPTEYLHLPFLDVVAFNVFLHQEDDLRAYLARLHHIAGNRPLLLAEVGADSIGHGEDGQAALTAMQLRTAFDEGVCGAITFGWTDDWWRGGHSVEDWAFGLVDRYRRPKPALRAVADVFLQVPHTTAKHASWPKVSVVVCACNAADTMDECLTSLDQMTYPSYEVIVVDDGSTDATAEIAQGHSDVELIEVPNGGLSAARNIGLAHATGEIIAYTDADVRVDPEWLTYLVDPILSLGVAGSGGPNVVPKDDPWFAQIVARAPGGPSHVLLDDRIAEHVPGCNMAFRRNVLLALDGFNPAFLRAGDDVDLCWRLQDRGWSIGFAPCALVWHHHRSGTRAYWRQQVGYGEGETWLKTLHPARFVGHRVLWRGHIYSPLPFVRSLRQSRISAGVWGLAAFPSVYHFDVHPLLHLPHSARWQVGSAGLLLVGGATLLTLFQVAGLVMSTAGLVGLGVTVAKCVKYAAETEIDKLPPIGRMPRRVNRLVQRAVLAWLHFLQPLARMKGRVRGFFVPLPPRSRYLAFRQGAGIRRPSLPSRDVWRSVPLLIGASVRERFWSERWVNIDALLEKITDWLRLSRAVDMIEIDDGWYAGRDLSVAAGRWLWLDVRAVVEDHGGRGCLLRVTTRARPTRLAWILAALLGTVAVGAVSAGTAAGGPAVSVAGLAILAIPVSMVASLVLRTAGVHGRFARASHSRCRAGGGDQGRSRDRVPADGHIARVDGVAPER